MLTATAHIRGAVVELLQGALVRRRAFETNDKVLSLMGAESELPKMLADLVISTRDGAALEATKDHDEVKAVGSPNTSSSDGGDPDASPTPSDEACGVEGAEEEKSEGAKADGSPNATSSEAASLSALHTSDVGSDDGARCAMELEKDAIGAGTSVGSKLRGTRVSGTASSKKYCRVRVRVRVRVARIPTDVLVLCKIYNLKSCFWSWHHFTFRARTAHAPACSA